MENNNNEMDEKKIMKQSHFPFSKSQNNGTQWECAAVVHCEWNTAQTQKAKNWDTLNEWKKSLYCSVCERLLFYCGFFYDTKVVLIDFPFYDTINVKIY